MIAPKLQLIHQVMIAPKLTLLHSEWPNHLYDFTLIELCYAKKVAYQSISNTKIACLAIDPCWWYFMENL